jgi:hypothetical protein
MVFILQSASKALAIASNRLNHTVLLVPIAKIGLLNALLAHWFNVPFYFMPCPSGQIHDVRSFDH